MEALKIIDVVRTRYKSGRQFGYQWTVVFNRDPVMLGELRTGKDSRHRPVRTIRMQDSGVLFYFYEHQPGSTQAFAGRAFNIRMADGTTLEAKGDYWSGCDTLGLFEDTPELVQVGYGTVESLKGCTAGYGGLISRVTLQAWIDEHGVCTDRHKYDPHTAEVVAEAVIKYDTVKVVSAKRVRTLRKRGVRIFRNKAGQRGYSPIYEGFLARRERIRKFDNEESDFI